MSDQIKHECGIVTMRLLKPLSYYQEKYGTALYGLNKLYLLMEKQHNRGQDGVGVANIKLDMPAGKRYISRARNNSNQPIKEIFNKIYKKFQEVEEYDPEKIHDAEWLKQHVGFMGELYLGHLRYGTHGINNIEACHPFLRQNNWMSRNLLVAGNFNMTNVDQLFNQLVELGQHPKEKSDTVTVLEKIGHFLDKQVEEIFDKNKSKGLSNLEISALITEELNIQKLLSRSAKDFDGGYVMCGLIGHGDAFILRDPSGIRPAYYYKDDEIVVATSERPAIQTAFNVPFDEIQEIKPGHALIIKKNGEVSEELCVEPKEKKSCSFERIYFSRGSDANIYSERKELGYLLTPRVLEAVGYDFDNTVFSYIPNTAQVSFYGLVKGVNEYLNNHKKDKILALGSNPSAEDLTKIISQQARFEKIAVKDAKLRTFITQDSSRDELVSHVYDVTYGVVKDHKDTLVLLDDSIVRGTTLRQSILKMVDRLNPKKIVVVSSAPQIRYPDCYGIDMSKLNEFVAFRAMISLVGKTNQNHLLQEAYNNCKEQLLDTTSETLNNPVQKLFNLFTDEEIEKEIAEIVKPIGVKAEVQVIYQSIENLHKACPRHLGDWYFSGNFPTPGGVRVVNKAFINFMEGKNRRAY